MTFVLETTGSGEISVGIGDVGFTGDGSRTFTGQQKVSLTFSLKN